MASKYKQRTDRGRHGPGISQDERDSVSVETKALINKGLISLVNNFDLSELTFPSSLSNIDRKLVHSLARDYGLKSKSKGIEPNRVITVYKGVMKGSQDFLTLTPKSLDIINRLLASNPVTNADKVSTESETVAQSSAKVNRRSQLSGAKLLLPRTDVKRTSTFRELLPISSYTGDVLFAIEEGRVILINSETGSGKTTQVPQMILEFAESQNKKCQIICSMPRRVAAVTISERVAFERGEPLGQTVGYQIRLDSRVSSQTILTYCTNGVLLRSLLGGDEWLNNVSHIILDEVHERDKLTDFSLMVLKDALVKYENLKLILKSATIDCEKYKTYFKHCPNHNDECTVVEVPGRMYEVKDIYLEHILEGTEYMSPEMSMMKEEKDALRFFQGNEGVNVSSQRSHSRAPVVSLEERIAMHPECGRTALMAAAIHSDIDAIDDLIHMDPDLSVESREGKTALMYAEEAGDSDVLDWFNAYMYVAGYMAKVVIDKYHCSMCKEDITINAVLSEPNQLLILYKSYGTKEGISRLTAPSKIMVAVTETILDTFHKHFPSIMYKPSVKSVLVDLADVEIRKVNELWLDQQHPCHDHRQFIINFLVQLKNNENCYVAIKGTENAPI